ncbi:hypothetical protein Lpl7_2136 [Lacticaseibacillus paracasei subsp. tolerans Lpl7]|nr:hypothetical protein Lpl7_2136 [Lacticaseibacillus paracasei subsp. tolerans Lpl7]
MAPSAAIMLDAAYTPVANRVSSRLFLNAIADPETYV